MKITKDYLWGREACPDQFNLFAETFPDGAEITRDNLLTAARAGLNVGWLARRVLKATAWAAYDGAAVSAQTTFDEAMVTAWAAYGEATATARAAYDKATEAAQTTFG